MSSANYTDFFRKYNSLDTFKKILSGILVFKLLTGVRFGPFLLSSLALRLSNAANKGTRQALPQWRDLPFIFLTCTSPCEFYQERLVSATTAAISSTDYNNDLLLRFL